MKLIRRSPQRCRCLGLTDNVHNAPTFTQLVAQTAEIRIAGHHHEQIGTTIQKSFQCIQC